MEERQRMIGQLVRRAIHSGGFMELDFGYLYHQFSLILGNDLPYSEEIRLASEEAEPSNVSLQQLFKDYQALSGQVKLEAVQQRQIIEWITPPPSVVNALFAQYYAKDPMEALAYFEQVMSEVGVTQYAERESATSEAQAGFYREGEAGKVRAGYRFIRLNLAGESWGLAVPALTANAKEFEVFPESDWAELTAEQKAKALLALSEVFSEMTVIGSSEQPGADAIKIFRLEELNQSATEVRAAYEQQSYPTLFPSVQAARSTNRAQTMLLFGEQHDDLVKALTFLLTLAEQQAVALLLIVKSWPEGLQLEVQLALDAQEEQTGLAQEGTSFDEKAEVWQNLISQVTLGAIGK